MIPENVVKDQFILKPIVGAMLKHLGRRATVRVCQNPVLNGVAEALDWTVVSEILDNYKSWADQILLIVDRDGNEGRQQRLTQLEELAADELGDRAVFLAENARQEVEVWVLAGMTDRRANWDWTAVRDEPNSKETYFVPYAKLQGVDKGPGGGRKVLAKEAAGKYDRVRKLCPEDVAALEERVAAGGRT